jgi:hypothetical protein
VASAFVKLLKILSRAAFAKAFDRCAFDGSIGSLIINKTLSEDAFQWRSSCSRKRLFSASSASIRSCKGAIRNWISSGVYFGVMCCEQFQNGGIEGVCWRHGLCGQ